MFERYGMNNGQNNSSLNLVPAVVAGSFVLPNFKHIPIQSP